MVCIICGKSTGVTNSRLQKRNNHVWRRRACTACGTVFTTTEQPELAQNIVVQYSPTLLRPFNRDRLFLAIYKSCEHRHGALEDAAALTEIVINDLRPEGSLLKPQHIHKATKTVLARYDPATATIYEARHPLTTS